MKRRARLLGAASALLSLVVGIGSARASDGANNVLVSVSVHDEIGPLNEGLLGTNQPVSSPKAATAIGKLGIDWARADMSLESSYSCSTRTWDPSLLDQRVQEDLAMGGEPELIVDYTPPCMTSNPLHETLDPPDAGDYGPWRALVEEAAYHEMTTNGVRVFEVWNEPDGTFWHGTIADYLAMYQETADAITAAATRARAAGVLVGGPALVFSDPAWLEPFLAYVDANHLALEFVSWHYYGNYPALGPFATGAGVLPPDVPAAGPYWYNPATRAQSYGLQVQQVKREIAKYPDLHPLTVIDEWNLDAGYDPRADQPYDAAFAAAVLDSVQSAGLDRMAFFRVADDKPGKLGNWGMLQSDFTTKPVYWTFAFWHALAGTRLAAAVTSGVTGPPGANAVTAAETLTAAGPSGTVGAVASSGTTGGFVALVYNYAPYGPGSGYAVELRFEQLGQGNWAYTVRMVDDRNPGTEISAGQVSRSGAVSLHMPAESVALVQLHRTN